MLDNSVACKSLLAVLGRRSSVSRFAWTKKHSVSLGAIDTEVQTESEVWLAMLIGHLADGCTAMPRPGGRQLVHGDINHDGERPVRTQDDLPKHNRRWWDAR
jgi:hypothetical protein